MNHIHLFVICLCFCRVGLSEAEVPFLNRIYTPEVVVDKQSSGAKGAVQLLWEKDPEGNRYEIEISNGQDVYSQVGEKHFHHVMIYYGKNYQWRVRQVSLAKTTAFSPWRSLKVVKKGNQSYSKGLRGAASASSSVDVEEYVLDMGE